MIRIANPNQRDIVIENLIIDGCQYYWPPSPEQALYGGIKLSGSINAVIRNVTIVNVKIGIMLSGSWSTSLENVRVFTNYYGIVLYNNNFTKLSSCYVSGKRLQDIQRTDISAYEALIEESFYPDPEEVEKAFFNKIDLTTNDFGFDSNHQDIIKRAKTGIWIGDSVNICMINTIVEYYTNGITQLASSSNLTDCYLEQNRYATFVIAGQSEPTKVNGLSISTVGEGGPKDNGIAGIGFGFYFGNHALASLNGIAQYTSSYYSPLFYNNLAVNRNIVFEKTLFSSRTYHNDIQFTDEGVNGQNLGSVYVDPTDGNDDNYGFNENDALQTFDAALIRVQNQSTINPVKVIYIKAAPIITESNPYTVGAAIKDISFKQIENVDILITSYGIDEQNPKGRILFIHDNIQYPTIGMVIFKGNVKLYFRDIDLFTKTTSSGWDDPSSLDYLSMFGLEGSYSKIIFDNMNIYLDSYYSIFRSLSPTKGSSVETKFLNTNVYANSSFVVPLPSLASYYSSSLIVDCVQINSTLSAIIYNQTNNGWNPAIIIRNNF